MNIVSITTGQPIQPPPPLVPQARSDITITALSLASEADLRDGLIAQYRAVRGAAMDKLRATWEAGRWIADALDTAKANGWAVNSLVTAMRKDGDIAWKPSTVRAYAQLGREDWRIVAKSGSVRKALEDMRDRNRKPEERQAMKERKRATRNRDRTHQRELAGRDREIDYQARRIKGLTERLRVAEAAADPERIRDLEEAVRCHAEAERRALKRAAAAEGRARAWEKRVTRIEREMAHLRLWADAIRSGPMDSVVKGPEQLRASFNQGR